MTPSKRSIIYDRSWIRDAREDMGLTRKEIAMRAGINPGHYGWIEQGVITPNVKYAIRLCEVLGLDVHNFLTEQELGFE